MNDDLKGLVDIGKLSEPVVKIIEAARDAIATLYQPSGIVRGAKAEAKALLVHTQADEEMKDIRMRAQASRDLELLRYQKNRERILQLAISLAPEKADEALPDPDWIAEFFEYSKNCSNEMMQTVWAKLLAGEVCHPGSFSRRALHAVRMLNVDEANCFTATCGFLWELHNPDGTTNYLVLGSPEDPDNLQDGFPIEYGILRRLEFLDLLAGSERLIEKEEVAEVSFNGDNFRVFGPVTLHMIALTPLGEELYPISGSVADPGHKEHFLEWLRKNGTRVESSSS